MKITMALLALFGSVCCSLAEPEAGAEWVNSYYQQPTPHKVVAQVREMAKEGMLKEENARPPFVAFLSQVMARNPGEVLGWLEALKELGEAPRGAVMSAAWFSDTEEARAFFQKYEMKEFLAERAPKILEMNVDNPAVLDMLWGCFMATGEEQPIRRLVFAFELSKYSGALDRFKTSARTDKDKEEAYYDATFQAALWSLGSNCRQHPRVLEHCEAIYADPALPEGQRRFLRAVLSKVKPEKYSLKDGEGSEGTVTKEREAK